MNIHHLELFYYVARHGGVSAAARRIPYGIQQPAISAQIIQLENTIGTVLFTRRPFQLTAAGEELFAFIEPFFGGLDAMALKLTGAMERSLRVGAAETVQHKYLPRLLKAMCRRFPALHFTLAPGGVEEIEAKILAREVDLGAAPLLGRRQESIRQEEILRVRMSLAVPRKSRITSAGALWQRDRIDEALIVPAAPSGVTRLFQAEMRKRGVEWYPAIQLNSQELITRYVAEGFGIGLVLDEPGQAPPPGVRCLPLEDFPEVPYGILWAGTLSTLQSAFLAEARKIGAEVARAAEGLAASA